MSCGASVRRKSRFCPHCGKSLTSKLAATEKKPQKATRHFGAEKPKRAQVEPSEAGLGLSRLEETSAPLSVFEAPLEKPEEHPPKFVARSVAMAIEAVEEKIAPSVEKVKKASHVVIDEAAEDPNLRFLLIALVLFVVFLFMLLLNRYLA